jgi:hypothetical protein
VAGAIDSVGTVVFFVVVGLFAVWVMREFVSGVPLLRREE